MTQARDPGIKIFVSFRRTDVGEQLALSVADALRRRLPHAEVFIDKHGVRPGPFPAQLHDHLATSHVVLALVGTNWRGVQPALPARIDDPKDWVRRELELALRADKFVIPVPVDGAALPTADVLPLPLRTLPDYQVYPCSQLSFDADLDRIAEALGRLELSPTLRMRAAEEQAFRQLADLVTKLQHEVMSSSIDLDELVSLAEQLHRAATSNEDVPLTDDGRRVFAASAQLAPLFARIPRPVYRYASARVHEAVTGGAALQIVMFAHRAQAADAYAFENAMRVLLSTRALLLAGIEGYTGSFVASPDEQVTIPASARFAVVAATGRGGLAMYTSRDGRSFIPLATYHARAHGAGRAQLRAATEPKLYAHDERSVYRWGLTATTPEAEWSVPDADLRTTFAELYVFPNGSIEFLVGTGWRGRRWIKVVGRPELIELSERADGTGAHFTAARTDLIGILPTSEGPLIIERISPDGTVTRQRLDIVATVRKLEPSLILNGKQRQFMEPLVNYADVALHRGVAWARLDCLLTPGGEAMIFLDAERGTLLRRPLLAYELRGHGQLVELGAKLYLVRSIGDGQLAAAAWDLSDPLEVREPRRVAEWNLTGFGDATVCARSASGEPLVLCAARSHAGERYFSIVAHDDNQVWFERVELPDAFQLYDAIALDRA